MSPAHVLEPTYQGLKSRLKTGVWPMGMRLEATRLADELGVSVTPVRDCLNRLVGERLVEFSPGEGYRVARLSERRFRDLLQFNLVLLTRAVGSVADLGTNGAWDAQCTLYPDRVAWLFAQVAAASGNAIVTETVEALNDRLHPARCLDPRLNENCETDIALFATLLRERASPAALAEWLNSYHARCCALAPDYVVGLELGPYSS